MVNVEKAAAQLFLHEGFEPRPYEDTLGNWTVACGYNLTARGVDDINRLLGLHFTEWSNLERPYDEVVLDRDQAQIILIADIKRVEAAVTEYWPTYSTLTEVRQRVIVDLVFNMGTEAKTFVRCKAAIERQDWSQAVRELYSSKWATQVGYGRAHRLGQMLLTGNDYTS